MKNCSYLIYIEEINKLHNKKVVLIPHFLNINYLLFVNLVKHV